MGEGKRRRKGNKNLSDEKGNEHIDRRGEIGGKDDEEKDCSKEESDIERPSNNNNELLKTTLLGLGSRINLISVIKENGSQCKGYNDNNGLISDGKVSGIFFF